MKLLYVEDCENWRSGISIRGLTCYACVNRNGYPQRGCPNDRCKNFKRARVRGELGFPQYEIPLSEKFTSTNRVCHVHRPVPVPPNDKAVS